MDASPVQLDPAEVAEARQLARRLAALPEAVMRLDALVQWLGNGDPRRQARSLEALIRGAIAHDEDCLRAYHGLIDPDPFVERVGEARLRDLLACGVDGGCIGAVQWLRGIVHAEPPREAIDPDRLVHWGLREITLGDRRALARRARGDELTQLVVDPDPGVIRNLLNNPRTTEVVVLAICTRRPQVPGPLREVLRAPRWIQRYRVKLSLVRNPYLELRFGLNLLVCLHHRDLCEVRADGSLSGILGLGAQRVMDLRALAGGEPSPSGGDDDDGEGGPEGLH